MIRGGIRWLFSRCPSSAIRFSIAQDPFCSITPFINLFSLALSIGTSSKVKLCTCCRFSYLISERLSLLGSGHTLGTLPLPHSRLDTAWYPHPVPLTEGVGNPWGSQNMTPYCTIIYALPISRLLMLTGGKLREEQSGGWVILYVKCLPEGRVIKHLLHLGKGLGGMVSALVTGGGGDVL